MARVKTYRDLEVWQVGMTLVEKVCRRTTPAFINHVSIALGSHGEIETCIEVALRLHYLSAKAKDDLMVTADSTGRLLNGLMHSLESREPQKQTP